MEKSGLRRPALEPGQGAELSKTRRAALAPEGPLDFLLDGGRRSRVAVT